MLSHVFPGPHWPVTAGHVVGGVGVVRGGGVGVVGVVGGVGVGPD